MPEENLITLGMEYLKANDFLAGGAILGSITGLAIYLKRVPLFIWETLKKRFIIQLYFESNDISFSWASSFLHEKTKNGKFSRKLKILSRSANLETVGSKKSSKVEKDFYYVPDVGRYYFKYANKFCMAIVDRREKEKSNSIIEDVRILILFGSKSIVDKLVVDCKNSYLEHRYKSLDPTLKYVEIKYYSMRNSHWSFGKDKIGRSLDSVILPKQIKDDAKNDFINFGNSIEWYRKRGITYKRNYLFHGPPGNGKSSFILALATELDKSISILDIPKLASASYLSFKDIINDLPNNTILILEDIDVLFGKEDTREIKNISQDSGTGEFTSFSEILNVLDGIETPEGLITILTTNHYEQLDPALKRSGRIDMTIELENATYDQIIEMFELFLEETISDDDRDKIKSIYRDKSIPMSDIQAICTEGKSVTEYISLLENNMGKLK